MYNNKKGYHANSDHISCIAVIGLLLGCLSLMTWLAVRNAKPINCDLIERRSNTRYCLILKD